MDRNMANLQSSVQRIDKFSKPSTPGRGQVLTPIIGVSDDDQTDMEEILAEIRRSAEEDGCPEDMLDFLVQAASKSLGASSANLHRIRKVEAATHHILNSSSSSSFSSTLYTFEPEVAEELARHPKEASHFDPEDFLVQMRSIPFMKDMPVATTIPKHDLHLLNSLSAIDRDKVTKWIPKSEGIWANQTRISAYLYDMFLKLSKQDGYSQLCDNCPGFEELAVVAQFNFYSCIGVRRSLALEKLELITRSLRLTSLDQDDPNPKRKQFPSLFGSDSSEIHYMARIKKHQDTLSSSFQPARQVFASGRGRGRASSGIQQTQQNRQEFPRRFNQRRRGFAQSARPHFSRTRPSQNQPRLPAPTSATSTNHGTAPQQ